ncbi:MAG TPA: hypothetical protein DD979_11075 [Gammaproteobacteria bacterium]|nr:hypothetical protein [Gammaproteobacteria bacterium]
MNTLEQHIMTAYRDHFPFSERPFRCIADQFNTQESAVLQTVRGLFERGYIRRIGPVFSPNAIDAPVTVAVSAQGRARRDLLAKIAFNSAISRIRAYAHDYDLWFQLTLDARVDVERYLHEQLELHRYRYRRLPVLREFDHTEIAASGYIAGSRVLPLHRRRDWVANEYVLSDDEQHVIRAVRPGLPVCSQPYAYLARRAGVRPRQLITSLQTMVRCGVVRRYGIEADAERRACHLFLLASVSDAATANIESRLAGIGAAQRGMCWSGLPTREWPYTLGLMLYAETMAGLDAALSNTLTRLQLRQGDFAVLTPENPCAKTAPSSTTLAL